MGILEDIKDDSLGMMAIISIFMPLLALWYYYRWAKYSTAVPFFTVVMFLVPVIVIEPYDTAKYYGSNTGLAGVSLTIFSLAFILFFITFLVAKFSNLLTKREKVEAGRRWYRENNIGFDTAFKTPILLPMIFILLWLMLSLAPASYLNGSWGTLIEVVWYLGMVFYIVWVFITVFIWGIIFGEKGLKSAFDLIW